MKSNNASGTAPQYRWVICVTLLLIAIFCLYQLVVPPIVGQSNTGDYWRIMVASGLDWSGPVPPSTLFLVREFKDTSPRFVGDGNPDSEPYLSSEILLIWIAKVINGIFNKANTFDLVSLGIVQTLIYTAGIAVILVACSKILRFAPFVLLCVLVLLISTDVGYVAYFNSVYPESASMIFGIYTIGFALMASIAKRATPWSFGLCIVSGLWLIAKTANVVLIVPIVFFAIVLFRARLNTS